MRALLCRRGSSSGEKKVRLRDATVDIGTAQVIRGEKVTRLTGREFKIFLVLLKKAGEIVTVRELCMALCGEHWEGYESTLLTHIYHIREKIEEKPSVPVSLITIKGLGYQLNILDKE